MVDEDRARRLAARAVIVAVGLVVGAAWPDVPTDWRVGVVGAVAGLTLCLAWVNRRRVKP